MPNVNDIVAIAEALEKSRVLAVQDRCVVVRNRNATCRRCVSACAAGALEVSNNTLKFDNSLCVGCGACTAACPTEALVFTALPDAALKDAAISTRDESGRVAIACARIASKHQADPARYAEVPCMARVEESLLLALVADGAEEVLLVDGNCATCKHRVCVGGVDAVVEQVNDLAAAHGSETRVQRVTGFPSDMLVENASGLFGSTRRGFFSDAVGAAKETALTAAKTEMNERFGTTESTPSIGDRLRVNEAGTLPLLRLPRHEATINALDSIGEPVVDAVETTLFAVVNIDVKRCNSCGMCAMFCPSGALKRNVPEKLDDPLTSLEFWACECVNCGMCADVCWKKALTLSNIVPTEQLYSFDPVSFSLSAESRMPRKMW